MRDIIPGKRSSMEVNVVEFLTREAAADCNEPRMAHPRRDNHQSTDKA